MKQNNLQGFTQEIENKISKDDYIEWIDFVVFSQNSNKWKIEEMQKKIFEIRKNGFKNN